MADTAFGTDSKWKSFDIVQVGAVSTVASRELSGPVIEVLSYGRKNANVVQERAKNRIKSSKLNLATPFNQSLIINASVCKAVTAAVWLTGTRAKSRWAPNQFRPLCSDKCAASGDNLSCIAGPLIRVRPTTRMQVDNLANAFRLARVRSGNQEAKEYSNTPR